MVGVIWVVVWWCRWKAASRCVGLGSSDGVRWDFISPHTSHLLSSQFYYDLHVGCTYCLGLTSSLATAMVTRQGTKEIKTRGVRINFLSIFKFTRKHLSSVIEVSIIKIYQKYWKTPTWEKKAVEGGNQYVRIEVHISLKLFHLFPIMKAAPNPPTPKP